MEDDKVIDLFFDRSERGILALKEKYGSRALSVASNILPDPRDAEEVVNDAIQVLWQRIPPERPQHLWAYFSLVVRNIGYDRLDRQNAAKRDPRSEVCLSELESCLSGGIDPHAILEAKEISEIINRFLQELSQKDRILFLRRYYYFDDCAKIAKRLGMTRSAVNTRLHRLRNQLRQVLEEEDVYL